MNKIIKALCYILLFCVCLSSLFFEYFYQKEAKDGFYMQYHNMKGTVPCVYEREYKNSLINEGFIHDFIYDYSFHLVVCILILSLTLYTLNLKGTLIKNTLKTLNGIQSKMDRLTLFIAITLFHSSLFVFSFQLLMFGSINLIFNTNVSLYERVVDIMWLISVFIDYIYHSIYLFVVFCLCICLIANSIRISLVKLRK